MSLIYNKFIRYFHQSRFLNPRLIFFYDLLFNWQKMFWTNKKFVFFINCSNWEKFVDKNSLNKLVKTCDEFVLKIKLTLWWLGPESFPFNECSLNRLFKSKHLISLVQVFQVTSWAWYNGCTEKKDKNYYQSMIFIFWISGT